MQQNSPQETPKSDARAKLKELKELFEDGLISEEEFTAAKAKIIADL
jgi:uncharacterized protein YqgQ